MADLFNPALPPQEGPDGTVKFNVSEIRFGEGYIGAVGEGINEKVQSWPLTWVGTDAEINPIRTFFDDHYGYESFLWTPPNDVTQGRYRVKEYRYTPMAAGNAKLMATLEQVFYP